MGKLDTIITVERSGNGRERILKIIEKCFVCKISKKIFK